MKYELTLNGKTYLVEVELAEPMTMEQYSAYAPMPAAPAVPVVPTAHAADAPADAPAPVAPGAGTCVAAPMPGTILQVAVTAGQQVREGQLLCVLEAMKMENEILAPHAGTVSQILTAKGAGVDTGDALVVLL